MLTTIEIVIFVALALASAGSALLAADRIRRIVRRGKGTISLDDVGARAGRALFNFLTLAPTWRTRLVPTLLHAFVAWAFIYYLIVNLGDVLQGLFRGFVFLGTGPIGDVYRLIADVLSVGALVGMTSFLVRRFAVGDSRLKFRETTT